MQTALSSADHEAEPVSRDKRAVGHHTHENWLASRLDDQLSHSRKSSVHDGDCAGMEVVEGSL